MSYSEAELRDFLISVAKRILRIKAIAPSSGGEGELKRAEEISRILSELGYSDVVRIDVRDSSGVVRPNIYLKIGNMERTLWIISHIDTVPVGDPTLWKYAPFDATVEGDRIYGRGSADNGQAIFTSLLLLKTLEKEKMKYNIGLAFVSDEETGNQYGIKPLIESGVFSKSDLILVPDSGSPDGSIVEISEKSILWIKFTVIGKQGHASKPETAQNSFLIASKLVIALESELKERFPDSDTLFKPSVSTFVPTRHEENVGNVNTIPGRDIFYFDCRVLPKYDLDIVMDEVKKITGRIESENGIHVKIDVVQRQESSPIVSKDSEINVKLAEALKATRNITPILTGIGGQTFANFLRQSGIPAAVWSTAEDSVYHQANEFCVISYIFKDLEVIRYMLYNQ